MGVCAEGGGGVTVYVGEGTPKRQRRLVLFPSVNFGKRQYSHHDNNALEGHDLICLYSFSCLVIANND